ncbi:hypothetical protein H0O02_04510 [Candidatus Micrarchaeota archaeon]|nr:hypothetical protein [Candidatus Micrarchaeota archaeon]
MFGINGMMLISGNFASEDAKQEAIRDFKASIERYARIKLENREFLSGYDCLRFARDFIEQCSRLPEHEKSMLASYVDYYVQRLRSARTDFRCEQMSENLRHLTPGQSQLLDQREPMEKIAFRNSGARSPDGKALAPLQLRR